MPLLRVPPLFGVLLVLWRALAGSGPPPVGRHPLPVLWMVPVSSEGGGANATTGLTLAVRMALDDLNGRAAPAPLGRYHIQADVIRAQCDLSSSLKSLFDAVWAGPKYRLLLGGACPSVAAQLARALPALRMVQVSYGPEASWLSDRKRYGNAFDATPSGRAVNLSAVRLLRRFGWTRVGLLAQDASSEMTTDLMNRVTAADVQLASVRTLPDHDCGALAEMKQLDVRVVVVVLAGADEDEDSLARVFCCASRLTMFGARHRWMVAGGRPRRRTDFRAPGCAAHRVAADGAIWLPAAGLAHSDTPGVSGRTRRDFERAYLREVRLRPGVRASPLAAYAYDATWAAAVALSHLTEALERRRDFHRNTEVGEAEATGALRDAVARTHFRGVTGPVSFRRGRRRWPVRVLQTQGSAGVTVGELDTTTNQLRLSERLLKFKGRSRAPEGDVLVYGVLSAVATVTAAVSLAVLCGAAVKRSRDALTTAVLLSAASVVAAAPDDGDFLARETTDALCSLRACLLWASHTLASASLLAQTWRRACGGGEVPSAFRLAFLLTSVDALLLCAWRTADRSRSDRARPWTTSERCGADRGDAWTAALCAYKAPLVVVGCWLRWSLPAGSRGAWPACALWAALSVASAPPLLSRDRWLDFCVVSVLVLACDVVVLAAAFLRNPIESGADGGSGAETGCEKLERRLEHQIAELDTQIRELTARLCDAEEAELVPQQTGSDGRRDVGNGDVNSPELVRRRLSVQLPILHLSYFAAVGGVSASSSAHFASGDA
ncbi:gamma-aminobutyric acid type B receptor subunit 2-like isoform X2 [Syngnathoides biaculeatus]|uniref:gamma-aminobutyric acid type B receptor subunit 2-like isoform X2 n=1 Tax=Syngnathoides biaculeatus TaxID=300417 RepID=UPI002ADD8C33|nr:gamma-aminobutyric acid type B receptor subunit 2-like isoform X2 [Syngnathoides biaculeatus]